ncbi:poly glycohydrolase [Neocallimastix californiae]|uniref:Poly glycohydrolase n=1 Tax=Neocallimastix californiae TaxID=1754190 RepID=A0A1Y2F038_9FUNG|nr:poly glycohydrolase [Neocallimastix californiae]|eukprot:ORY77077.1 poly glycohydrolase [Neocallimastix californiae]
MRKKELHNLKTELITFQRVSLDEQSIPDWENTSVKLCNIIIDKEKFIEDCENMIQVDFANSYIGDGVLTLGCVQEEIRFAINPELLVSLNFTQRLDPLESVYIIGVERVSKYKCYGYTFQYDGDYDDSSIAL